VAAKKGLPLLGSLDTALEKDDIQYETVDVPEWGVAVRLVSLDGLARNRVAQAVGAHAKKLGSFDEAWLYFQARIIVESMVNEAGEHIGDQKQAAALMHKNGGVLTRLFSACKRLSGVGEDEQEEAVEELKGTPSAVTGSD
jgi:hypothetical protein